MKLRSVKATLLCMDELRSKLDVSPLLQISEALLNASKQIIEQRPHGDANKWLSAIESLPDLDADEFDYNSPAVKISSCSGVDTLIQMSITDSLMQLHPWRKGPFDFFGVTVDSEWRSDLKWDRIENHIQPLKNRVVLDVGCGNGYYMMRMLGKGAKYVLGIDPTQLFIAQFKVVQKYVKDLPSLILPLRCEELPLEDMARSNIKFDSVFSMGILYHRRQPMDHLNELKRCLRRDGELILETLVIDEDSDAELVPPKSYAKMPNVRSIPTPKRLVRLLHEANFKDVQIVDITKTSEQEQRSTPWMKFESLSDYLDSNNPSKTIEGHPAPLRICLTARA